MLCSRGHDLAKDILPVVTDPYIKGA